MDSYTERILDCLRKAAPRDLHLDEIVKATGIHRNTVGKYVYALVKEGRIVETRRIGRIGFYTIPKEKK